MLNIFLTVDTEVRTPKIEYTDSGFWAAYQRDILGRTAAGECGLPLQFKIMADYGIRGSFFVEALYASAVGLSSLQDTVGIIAETDSEVQLHTHIEWARIIPALEAIYNGGYNLADYSEDQQCQVIGMALENLVMAGAGRPRAFRAGNYGADFATLRALVRLGLEFDSSYNYCYLNSDCSLRMAEAMLEPGAIEGLTELPISFFQDWPGHYRHAQLTACSFGELSAMLDQACEQGRTSFVIVSHSFELLNSRRTAPDKVVIRRFQKLCAFIAANSDRMQMKLFGDLGMTDIVPAEAIAPLRSNLLRTSMRYSQQLLRRIR